jgi:hypothetical protein
VAIESLTICYWSQTAKRDEVISDPSWTDVEAAVRLLDNEARNDVYLKPLNSAQDTFLGVGGGAGRYIVTGSEHGSRFPTLSNPTAANDLISLCVGGQRGEYPSRLVVDLEQALAAVRLFYEAGTFDCGVSWEYM